MEQCSQPAQKCHAIRNPLLVTLLVQYLIKIFSKKYNLLVVTIQTTEADEELPLDDSDNDGCEDGQDIDVIQEDNEEPSLYPDTNIGFKVVSGK